MVTCVIDPHQEQENVRLLASHKDQQQALAKLEDTLTAMRGEAVDQQNLLSTIAQDKATVSRYVTLPPTVHTSHTSHHCRAVAQNKELKNQLAELQEAFVQQTHRNMELATELETQQLKIHRLEQQAETTEPMSVTQEQEKRQHVDQTTAATQSEDVDTSSLHISRIQVQCVCVCMRACMRAVCVCVCVCVCVSCTLTT